MSIETLPRQKTPCSGCGNLKSYDAKLCKSCHMEAVTKKHTCNKCGAKTDKRSQRKSGLCRSCYKAAINVNGPAICRNCGGKTSEPRAEFCKSCWDARPTDGIRVTQRRSRLKAWFKISLDQYDEMLKAQNGCCAICGIHHSAFTKSLFVDHDRKCCPTDKSCGKCVRGLLCLYCNFGIGYFKDDVERMKKATEYVEKYNKEIGER